MNKHIFTYFGPYGTKFESPPAFQNSLSDHFPTSSSALIQEDAKTIDRGPISSSVIYFNMRRVLHGIGRLQKTVGVFNEIYQGAYSRRGPLSYTGNLTIRKDVDSSASLNSVKGKINGGTQVLNLGFIGERKRNSWS